MVDGDEQGLTLLVKPFPDFYSKTVNEGRKMTRIVAITSGGDWPVFFRTQGESR